MQAKTARVIAEGIVAGVIAHLGIALVLLVADLVAGRWILFTPALLGTVLLEGARDICQVPLRVTTVLAYTSIHLTALAAFGLLASMLIHASEQRPILWLGALFVFIFVAWHLTGAVLTLVAPVRGCFSLWWITGASAVGALGMAGYLWRAHPGLRQRLRGERYA
jgi:hypothetical protein